MLLGIETYRRGVLLKLSENHLNSDGFSFVSQSLFACQLAFLYDRVSAEYMPSYIRVAAKAVDELWISLVRASKNMPVTGQSSSTGRDGDAGAGAENKTVKDLRDYMWHDFQQVFALVLLVGDYFLPSDSSPEEMSAFIMMNSLSFSTFALILLVLLIATGAITFHQLCTSLMLVFQTIVAFFSKRISKSSQELSDEENCIEAYWPQVVALSILLVWNNFLPLYSPTTEDFLRLRSSIVSPLGSLVCIFLILFLIASASWGSTYRRLNDEFKKGEFVKDRSKRSLAMMAFLGEANRSSQSEPLDYDEMRSTFRTQDTLDPPVAKVLEDDTKMWTLSYLVRIFAMPPVVVLQSERAPTIGPVLSAASSFVVGISWDIFVDLDALSRNCVALSYIGGSFFFLCVAIAMSAVEVGAT